MQALADVHETPLRSTSFVPVGLGVVWVVQMLPFQRSTKVANPGPES